MFSVTSKQSQSLYLKLEKEQIPIENEVSRLLSGIDLENPPQLEELLLQVCRRGTLSTAKSILDYYAAAPLKIQPRLLSANAIYYTFLAVCQFCTQEYVELFLERISFQKYPEDLRSDALQILCQYHSNLALKLWESPGFRSPFVLVKGLIGAITNRSRDTVIKLLDQPEARAISQNFWYSILEQSVTRDVEILRQVLLHPHRLTGFSPKQWFLLFSLACREGTSATVKVLFLSVESVRTYLMHLPQQDLSLLFSGAEQRGTFNTLFSLLYPQHSPTHRQLQKKIDELVNDLYQSQTRQKEFEERTLAILESMQSSQALLDLGKVLFAVIPHYENITPYLFNYRDLLLEEDQSFFLPEAARWKAFICAVQWGTQELVDLWMQREQVLQYPEKVREEAIVNVVREPSFNAKSYTSFTRVERLLSIPHFTSPAIHGAGLIAAMNAGDFEVATLFLQRPILDRSLWLKALQEAIHYDAESDFEWAPELFELVLTHDQRPPFSSLEWRELFTFACTTESKTNEILKFLLSQPEARRALDATVVQNTFQRIENLQQRKKIRAILKPYRELQALLPKEPPKKKRRRW